MKKLLAVFAALMISGLSYSRDVLPVKMEKGDKYVRVTKLSSKRVQIAKCKHLIKNSCRLLGNKKSYSLKELKSQRSNEQWQVVGSVLGDVGLAAATYASAGGAAYVVGAIASGSATAGGWILVGVGAGVAGGSTTALFTLDALNPYEQYKQAETLREDVINDRDVREANIEDFIERLDLVLSKF